MPDQVKGLAKSTGDKEKFIAKLMTIERHDSGCQNRTESKIIQNDS